MTDHSINRSCPLCGEKIEAFRGAMVTKGSLPPDYIRYWNDDIRACDNLHDRSELIDNSFWKGLYRVFKGKSFSHPNEVKARDRYGYNPDKV